VGLSVAQQKGNGAVDGLELAKSQMIEAARRAYQRGIQTGTGGNLSARVPGEALMVVKPSGISFIECTPDNLVVTDFDGKLVAGTGKPSREALLHGALYRAVPALGGVVHCHSPWSIAWGLKKRDLPLITYHSQLKFGVPLPTLNVEAPVVPAEAFPQITALFAEHPKLPGFLLVAHGVVAVGRDAIAAEHVAELVEETAQNAFLHALDTRA